MRGLTARGASGGVREAGSDVRGLLVRGVRRERGRSQLVKTIWLDGDVRFGGRGRGNVSKGEGGNATAGGAEASPKGRGFVCDRRHGALPPDAHEPKERTAKVKKGEREGEGKVVWVADEFQRRGEEEGGWCPVRDGPF